MVAMNIKIKKLQYRSMHRGCKETDYIFTDFAATELHALSDQEVIDYEKLLEVDDATLYSWFNGASAPVDEYDTSVFHKIKKFNEGKFKKA